MGTCIHPPQWKEIDYDDCYLSAHEKSATCVLILSSSGDKNRDEVADDNRYVEEGSND